MSKALIAYFSKNGENYVSGQIVRLETGNTEIIAQMISELTSGDLFKIEPQIPYAEDHMTCINEAKKDMEADARPALKTLLKSIDHYDVIYLGYPNYWNTMPMAVFTFLEHFDFSGKRIKPFCTHEGSGLGNSIQDIQKLCQAAHIEQGLAIVGGSVKMAKPAIEGWL